MPNHLLHLHSTAPLPSTCTLLRRTLMPPWEAEGSAHGRAQHRNLSRASPPQCAAHREGLLPRRAPQHLGQTLLPDGGGPQDLRKERHVTRLHVPDADSTWAPFTFRGVRTTRGSITPVFFFCLFACIPEGSQKEAESPAGPQDGPSPPRLQPPSRTAKFIYSTGSGTSWREQH